MIFKKLLWWLSLPLLILILPQAIYVKRTTLRLPEASGDRQYSSGNSKLNIMHVGESTVAGVGVEDIQQGITVHLAKQIGEHLNQDIGWSIHGVNGIRISELNDNISQLSDGHIQNHHLFFVSLGVNDTTKFTSLNKWKHHLEALVNTIQHSEDTPIIFTQVPPMAQFPALPAPLKHLLGLRAHLLDLELQRFCEVTSNVYYVGSEIEVAKEMMAEDGYHPSALGYEKWAAKLLPTIKEVLKQKDILKN